MRNEVIWMDKKHNGIVVTTDKGGGIPVKFNEINYNFEIINDEKELLNEIKIKNIDIVIIIGPLKYLDADELFTIILEKNEINNKQMRVIKIEKIAEEKFEVKMINNSRKKYSAVFIKENSIYLTDILAILNVEREEGTG